MSGQLALELIQSVLSLDLLLHQSRHSALLLPLLSPQSHDAFVGRSDDKEVGSLGRVQVTLSSQLVEAALEMSPPVLLETVVNLARVLTETRVSGVV